MAVYPGISDPPACLTKSHWDYAALTYDYVDDGGVQTYRQANDGPYTHYVDPTHPSATNTSNPYGTPSKPRLWVTLSTLAAGSVVEYHNFTTTSWTTSSGINGTEALPIFIRADTNDRSFILRQLLLRDSISYVIFENVDFDKNDLNTALVESDWNSSADVCSYVAFRDCDIHNLAEIPNQGRLAFYLGHRTGVGIDDHILIKDCRFYDWGFGRTAATNYDCSGIFVGPRVSYVWILDNTFDQIGGDSIQLNAQSMTASYDPPHHVYIGGNTATRMYENFVDLKTCNDVVISRNTSYNMGILCEGNDLGETNGAGGGFIRLGPGDATDPTKYRYNCFIIFNHFYNGGSITVAEGAQWGDVSFANTRNTEIPADETYFIGNLVHDVHNSAGDSQCLVLSDQARVYFLNNTFYNVDQVLQLSCKEYGDTQSYTDAKTFANNLVIQHASATRNVLEILGLSASFATQVIRNNLWYKDGGGDVTFRVGVASPTTGFHTYTNYATYALFAAAYSAWATDSLNADPVVVSLSLGNMALTASSPCVSAGYAHSGYSTFYALYAESIAQDYAGLSVPIGTLDIGAYEFTGSDLRHGRYHTLLSTTGHIIVKTHEYTIRGNGLAGGVTAAAAAAVTGSAVSLLYNADFDDQLINSPLSIRNGSGTTLSAPDDFTFEAGRGGSGYCVQSVGAGAGSDVRFYLPGNQLAVNDEFYVSFWIRFPSFTPCSYFNMKLFYPHFTHVSGNSYWHIALQDIQWQVPAGATPGDSSGDGAYWSAMSDDVIIESSQYAAMPYLSDGNWHQCEFYVRFSTASIRFWYDGVLTITRDYGSGVWSSLLYISGPAEDASGGGGYQTFVRQVDDYIVCDGIPS